MVGVGSEKRFAIFATSKRTENIMRPIRYIEKFATGYHLQRSSARLIRYFEDHDETFVMKESFSQSRRHEFSGLQNN